MRSVASVLTGPVSDQVLLFLAASAFWFCFPILIFATNAWGRAHRKLRGGTHPMRAIFYGARAIIADGGSIRLRPIICWRFVFFCGSDFSIFHFLLTPDTERIARHMAELPRRAPYLSD